MKKQSGLLRRLTALALALCMLAALTAEIFAADIVASGYCGGEGDGTKPVPVSVDGGGDGKFSPPRGRGWEGIPRRGIPRCHLYPSMAMVASPSPPTASCTPVAGAPTSSPLNICFPHHSGVIHPP